MESNIRKLTYIAFVATSFVAGLIIWYVFGGVADIASLPSPIYLGEAGVDGTLELKLSHLQTGVATVFGVGTFIGLFMNTTAVEFTDDCFAELYKVTWPTRKETVASSIVVGVMVLVAALMFQIMDLVWGGIFGLIFS